MSAGCFVPWSTPLSACRRCLTPGCHITVASARCVCRVSLTCCSGRIVSFELWRPLAQVTTLQSLRLTDAVGLMRGSSSSQHRASKKSAFAWNPFTRGRWRVLSTLLWRASWGKQCRRCHVSVCLMISCALDHPLFVWLHARVTPRHQLLRLQRLLQPHGLLRGERLGQRSSEHAAPAAPASAA